jgi:hypothetical protein
MVSNRLLEGDCAVLENQSLVLQVAKEFGPRVISLCLRGGENIFAEIPHLVLECPGKGGFHLHGGHRLWHAPEDPAITYLPDDAPVEISSSQDQMDVIQALEPETGLQKSIHMRLPDQTATVILEHTIFNKGTYAVECAPWAISQMKPGGTAILPQNMTLADKLGVLPNRNLALWPYTNPGSRYITWGREAILVHANLASDEEKLKLGFPNPRGWIAYHRQDTLFVKYAKYIPDQPYYDFGTSSQCYCGPEFIELETLGPRVILPPGGSVSHTETWQMIGETQLPRFEHAADALAESLSLDSRAATFTE